MSREKMYCIMVTRELDGDYVFHKSFDHTPTRSEVLKAIVDEDCGYDDNYGKFRFFGIEKTLNDNLYPPKHKEQTNARKN